MKHKEKDDHQDEGKDEDEDVNEDATGEANKNEDEKGDGDGVRQRMRMKMKAEIDGGAGEDEDVFPTSLGKQSGSLTCDAIAHLPTSKDCTLHLWLRLRCGSACHQGRTIVCKSLRSL